MSSYLLLKKKSNTLIIKRFMNTSMERKPKNNTSTENPIPDTNNNSIKVSSKPKREIIEEKDSNNQNDSIRNTVASPQNENSSRIQTLSPMQQLEETLSPEEREQINRGIASQRIRENNQFNNNNNETYNTNYIHEPLYVPPNLTPEIFVTNTIIQSVSANIEELGKRLDIEVQKSQQLALEWKNHLKALSEYIASLKELPWKKILSYTACAFTILGFLYKMGGMKAIPDFTSNLVSALISVGAETKKSAVKQISEEIPTATSHSFQEGFNAFMNSSLTPLTMFATLGGAVAAVGALKLSLQILRFIQKVK